MTVKTVHPAYRAHPDNVPDAQGDTVHDGVCVQTHSSRADTPIVKAYRAAYIAGECLREVGATSGEIPDALLQRVDWQWDSTARAQMVEAILDGFHAGVRGDVPLGDMQILIHYD